MNIKKITIGKYTEQNKSLFMGGKDNFQKKKQYEFVQ